MAISIKYKKIQLFQQKTKSNIKCKINKKSIIFKYGIYSLGNIKKETSQKIDI